MDRSDIPSLLLPSTQIIWNRRIWCHIEYKISTYTTESMKRKLTYKPITQISQEMTLYEPRPPTHKKEKKKKVFLADEEKGKRYMNLNLKTNN